MKGLQYERRLRPDGREFPRQRWLVQMEIQGDSEDEIIANLRDFLFRAESKQTSWQSVGCGIIVSSDVDDQYTKERYRAEVEEFTANKEVSE